MDRRTHLTLAGLQEQRAGWLWPHLQLERKEGTNYTRQAAELERELAHTLPEHC
jgi:hypothetical protein